MSGRTALILAIIVFIAFALWVKYSLNFTH